ncbi:hypothetical protein M0R88_15075 [Halorussus gelatinilyticus]|uniref:Uncharacterized protein n=1 Tax=Halorussus gelatinilyticus TaxID=2937524 RepID=A0A8U0IIB3_9EURY|nr:hypothetical protein [Halorussus gelatinilyticus]UPV99828.1 hypothetical protein M0R88_15075 [Halorussus gelatinilyticus]
MVLVMWQTILAVMLLAAAVAALAWRWSDTPTVAKAGYLGLLAGLALQVYANAATSSDIASRSALVTLSIVCFVAGFYLVLTGER